ncbi:MAG: hypothetical protein R6V11_00400 [Ectothiorhodospiraceae bacterium]
MKAHKQDANRADEASVVPSLADPAHEPDEAALDAIMQQVADTAQALHTVAMQRFEADMQAFREQVRSTYLRRSDSERGGAEHSSR